MEQEKRGRGRPKIDTHLTEIGAPSRRQAINAMYMFEGVHLLSVAATDIPDSHLLWESDDATMTAKSKNGILEQLGRMMVQDNYKQEDCVYITNLAIAALKNGKTSREIEKAIRTVRMTNKKVIADPDNERFRRLAIEAANELDKMGGADE
ncbi:hypothetical protein [uncultured Ruminococcus sp.]|uniref:hypothetical protein n=1 Tax=uncultured Ruminococcus sp. TaxID=165186 RepID=UPI00266672E3|nr:hypothetical protein [uncultured Ruminococcus sp.]